MKAFGTLITFDCGECEGLINDRQVLDDFISRIVKVMKMERVGKPTYEWFDDTPFNREHDLIGYSVTQIISLSSITLHICSMSKSTFIDIFTCCKVNEDIISELEHNVHITFNPKTVTKNTIKRVIP